MVLWPPLLIFNPSENVCVYSASGIGKMVSTHRTPTRMTCEGVDGRLLEDRKRPSA